ncbi:MAG: hypothetical protein WBB85_12380 [Albidovulum sp.]|uniref:hypothetical protein n=1 Tax=Albidovulum sp. TaxID=1872424 RepID=UPI003C8B9747
MMPDPSSAAFELGVRNLLLICAGARPGDRVLLVGESGPSPYFEPGLCDAVAGVARHLGMTAEVVIEPPVADADHFPAAVREAMTRTDRTIFFSRLGDQVRFALGPGQSPAVMTYTLSQKYLGHAFATADFAAMKAMHDALLDLILGAESYRISGACGTDLTGRVRKGRKDAVADFALELFPVMIFPPVVCDDLNGVLVIQHFVSSSSTRAYDDSVLILDAPIRVTVEKSRMTAFEGPEGLVTRLKSQLERAAGLTGGDPWAINSWHTGINPNTFFEGDPYADLELWGTVAYGSPRYTHLHAAGRDPGDAAFHLMDATISFDGKAVWDRGRFVFLDRPEIQALIAPEHRASLNASVLQTIGM